MASTAFPFPDQTQLDTLHSFSPGEDAWITEQLASGVSWVKAALELDVQPSLVYLRAVSLNLIDPTALKHTEKLAIDNLGYIQLPPVPDVISVIVREGNTPEKQAHMFQHEHEWQAARVYGTMAAGLNVHHINFIHYDNRPVNLWPCTGSRHLAAQASMYGLIATLVADRDIYFDRDVGRYVIGAGLQALHDFHSAIMRGPVTYTEQL